MLEKIIEGTRAYFKESGKRRAVIGLSGGIDSALCCFIAAKALGGKNVFAYHLPYFEENDVDVKAVAKHAGVNLETKNIRHIVDSAARAAGVKDLKQKGNVMARVRMVLLYAFAAKHDALVVGTSNRTELALGYFTKHGDGSADVLPIGALYKTQVRKLAGEAGLPEKIVEKTPTAGLWAGQTDEGEIGLSYGDMDFILENYFDKGRSVKQLLELGAKKKNVERVLSMVKTSEHKRQAAPVIGV